jgi:hypothetical protein
MDTDSKTKRRGAEDMETRRVENLCDSLRSLRLCVFPHLRLKIYEHKNQD